MDKIRIALIDDQRLFREGLAALLVSKEDMNLLAEYENGKVFMELLPAMEYLPHVLLVDMNMPEMNGAVLTDLLHKTHPDIKIIILTVYDQERFVHKMISAGAAGYLLKNCDIEEVLLAIRTAYKTGFYFNEAVLKAMRNGEKYRGTTMRNINNIPIELTTREQEILHMICKELTNTEIGEQLHISARTVDGHRNNLLAKTGCRNTAGLVLFAVSNGIFEVMA